MLVQRLGRNLERLAPFSGRFNYDPENRPTSAVFAVLKQRLSTLKPVGAEMPGMTPIEFSRRRGHQDTSSIKKGECFETGEYLLHGGQHIQVIHLAMYDKELQRLTESFAFAIREGVFAVIEESGKSYLHTIPMRDSRRQHDVRVGALTKQIAARLVSSRMAA